MIACSPNSTSMLLLFPFPSRAITAFAYKFLGKQYASTHVVNNTMSSLQKLLWKVYSNTLSLSRTFVVIRGQLSLSKKTKDWSGQMGPLQRLISLQLSPRVHASGEDAILLCCIMYKRFMKVHKNSTFFMNSSAVLRGKQQEMGIITTHHIVEEDE